MNDTLELRTWPSPLPSAALIGVFVLSIYLSFSAAITEHPELAFAVTFDLALSAPFFYFLAIRKTRIPKITVITVFGLGIATAFYCVPAEKRYFLNLLAFYGIPLIEVCVFGFIIYRLIGVYKSFKTNAETAEFRTVLNNVAADVFGDTFLARAVAYELAVLSYAILPIKKTMSRGATFSYHKDRGSKPLYLIILFVILAESVVVHILAAQWSLFLAWFFTLSSLYIMFFLTAHMRAASKRPIELTRDILTIRSGLSCDAEIPLSFIAKAEPAPLAGDQHSDALFTALLAGMEPPDVIITLHRPSHAVRMYGMRKEFSKIAFSVDDRDRFLSLLKHYGVE